MRLLLRNNLSNNSSASSFQQPQHSSASSSRSTLVHALSELQTSRCENGSTIQAIASHKDILQVYQQNAKKSNDPSLQLDFCNFLFDYAETIEDGQLRKTYQNEAIEWLRKLATMNVKDDLEVSVLAEAQFRLAECLRLGLYGPCDLVASWKLYEMAAKKGNAHACYRAGICCEQGIGRRVNLSRALLYYRKSAGMIHFPSMFKLVTIYVYQSEEFHIGGGNANGKGSNAAFEGFKWLKIVATHTLNNPAGINVYALACLYELGMWYAQGPPNTARIPDFTLDNEYAIELIYEAGRRGYSPAAYKLGEIFERGLYGVKPDKASAIFWFRKVMTYTETGEDDFIIVDEWKRSAQRKIAIIETSISNKSGKRESVIFTSTMKEPKLPPPLVKKRGISENGKRILSILTERKKLRRDSLPTPIITNTRLRVRQQVKAY